MSHQKIIDETRYKIDSNNSVVIDRTKAMSRKQTRTTDTVKKMVQDIEYFLNNIDEYITDSEQLPVTRNPKWITSTRIPPIPTFPCEVQLDNGIATYPELQMDDWGST